MKCEFCGSQVKAGVDKCPNCGAAIFTDAVIPPPSPYYTETVGPDQVIPEPEVTTHQVVVVNVPRPAQTFTVDPAVRRLFQGRELLGLISLVLGIIGLFSIPLGLCILVINVPGIILGAMGLKSSQRKLAVIGIVLNVFGIVAGFVMTIFVISMFSMGDILKEMFPTQ